VSGAETYAWQGRPVTFKDFTVKDLDAVRAAFTSSNVEGMWFVLSLSAHYADGDGERVFQDVAAVEGSPARYAHVLMRMAVAAMAANGMQRTEDGGDGRPLS
jgi:hypothetical protein